MDHILEGHQEAMVERCRLRRLVLAVHDTMFLDCNDLEATEDLVGIGGGGSGTFGIAAYADVIDNPRYLILPWVAVPNFGSHILSLVRKPLPGDWTARYGTTPVLCETFVEVSRHSGGVYRASGWIRVGTTRARGRYDRHNKADRPKKDICLLRKDWKRTLNR